MLGEVVGHRQRRVAERLDLSRELDPFLAARVGIGQFIPGFDEGLTLMREGGDRWVIIPPELGYGSVARPGIPENSTLVFRLELLSVTQ